MSLLNEQEWKKEESSFENLTVPYIPAQQSDLFTSKSPQADLNFDSHVSLRGLSDENYVTSICSPKPIQKSVLQTNAVLIAIWSELSGWISLCTRACM